MNNSFYNPTLIDAEMMESADTSSLVETIAAMAMNDADDFYSEI